MDNVEEVQDLGGGCSRWLIKGPAGNQQAYTDAFNEVFGA